MRFILFFICIFLFTTLKAQQSTDVVKVDYAKDPAWIKMIDNPSTNYYEALKAYDEYWKNHEQPSDEEELMNQGREKVDEDAEKEKEKKERLTPAEKEESNMMRYQCKRFENWQREVFPFVQPDGHILSEEERLKIWNQQQEEMKKQNHK